MSGSGVNSVSIANRALSDAGTRSTISSFTEGSNESNAVSLIYAPVRQQALRAAHWGMAGATATLSLLKSAPGTLETPAYPTSGVWSSAYPPPPWSYEYAYPPDCLQCRKLVMNYSPRTGGAVPMYPNQLLGGVGGFAAPGQMFSVATDLDNSNNQISVILANIDQAILSYTRDIVVESLWDPQFQECVVGALAAKLAWALAGDKGRANDLMKMANDKLLIARAGDGNESLTVMDHSPDWITIGHGARWFGSEEWGGGWLFPFGPLFSSF
jgi:hypothetical protein